MPTATFAAVTGSLAPTFTLWRVSLCLSGCSAAAPKSNASWFITATLIRELLLQITLLPEIWALPSHLVWLEKQPFSPPFTSQSLNTFFLPFSCLLLGSNDSKVCKRVAKWIFFASSEFIYDAIYELHKKLILPDGCFIELHSTRKSELICRSLFYLRYGNKTLVASTFMLLYFWKEHFIDATEICYSRGSKRRHLYIGVDVCKTNVIQ